MTVYREQSFPLTPPGVRRLPLGRSGSCSREWVLGGKKSTEFWGALRHHCSGTAFLQRLRGVGGQLSSENQGCRGGASFSQPGKKAGAQGAFGLTSPSPAVPFLLPCLGLRTSLVTWWFLSSFTCQLTAKQSLLLLSFWGVVVFVSVRYLTSSPYCCFPTQRVCIF